MLALLQTIMSALVKLVRGQTKADRMVAELRRQAREREAERQQEKAQWQEQLAENDQRWRKLNDSYQSFAASMNTRATELEREAAKLQAIFELERQELRNCRQENQQWRTRQVILEDENRDLKKRVATLEGMVNDGKNPGSGRQ